MEETTNLSEIMGIPERIEEETEQEYIGRVIFERKDEIKEAILYDVAMGVVDWTQAGMPLDDFCEHWIKIYTENVIEGLGFENLPVL